MSKLVRDRIPEIIKAAGDSCETHIADDEEYWQRLREKLQEEVDEYLENETDEELADVLEVIYAILDAKGVKREAIEELRKLKARQRGSFTQRIILDRS